MFTQQQIASAYAKVKSGDDYPKLVQDLKRIGVRSYDHNVDDGSNVFYGGDGESLSVSHLGPPQSPIAVAEVSAAEKLKHAIALHQKGLSNYPTLCGQAGEAGVAKWVSDLEKMTCTYIDKAENILLIEPIPTGGY